MSALKIHIWFKFTEGPGGGGASFLLNLKNELIKRGLYAERAEEAEVILFNSHHEIKSLINFKRKYPEKTYIHRIDGPMSLYNDSKDKRDKLVQFAAKFLADAVVFQSRWCQEKSYELTLVNRNIPCTVIPNAVDDSIFKTKINPTYDGRKLKIMSSGWSTNPNKGFSDLVFLDQHLDWNKIEMIFVGNTPHHFEHIKILPPTDRNELAKMLSLSDVYFFSSRFEACSNALMEAEAIGLPTVAFNGSSNSEFVTHSDLLYSTGDEAVKKIELLCSRYQLFWENNKKENKYKTLTVRADQYIAFFQSVLTTTKKSPYSYCKSMLAYFFARINSKN